MIRHVIAARAAVARVAGAVVERLQADDRGAVTAETAIITGVLVVAAITLTGVILGVITDYQSLIPGGG